MKGNGGDGEQRLKKITIDVDDTPVGMRGTGGSSLYRSGRAAGEPAKAVQAYLKALATKLSLDRDVSANDKFDIILGYRRAETGEVEVGDLLFAGLERGKKKDVNLLKWTADGRSHWFEASGVGEQRGQLVATVEIGKGACRDRVGQYGEKRGGAVELKK